MKSDCLIDFLSLNLGECHHIVPKSIDPSLAKFPLNIVRLTYREHYIAHLCLYKIYENDEANRHKMGTAWMRMCKNVNNLHVTSHEFELAKKANRECQKGRPSPNKGKHLSEEAKQKDREAHLGKSTGPCSLERRQHISQALKGKNTWAKGRKLSEEHKRKISEANKNISDELRQKRSEWLKGNKSTTGFMWYNDGMTNLFVKECPGPDWKKGRIYVRKKA